MGGRELIQAGWVLADEGLVTAFGHVSKRLGETAFLITPARSLGTLAPDEPCIEVSLESNLPPAGAPGEFWLHWAIYRARPDVRAICRAQPESATAAAAAGVAIRPLHGQGAFLGGEVPVYDDARLIRQQQNGEALAASLGSASALLMAGNGAVTVGDTVGEAVARMWVLEVSARMNLAAASANRSPRPLREEEFTSWQAVSKELLGRIWAHFVATASQRRTQVPG